LTLVKAPNQGLFPLSIRWERANLTLLELRLWRAELAQLAAGDEASMVGEGVEPHLWRSIAALAGKAIALKGRNADITFALVAVQRDTLRRL